MLRLGGMSLWRLLFLVFGFWMIVILFVTMELSSAFFKDDKDRSSLDRIKIAEETVSELKARNLELQRMLSSLLKSDPFTASKHSAETLNAIGEIIARPPTEKEEISIPSTAQETTRTLSRPPPLNEDLFLRLSDEYKDLYNQLLESWFFIRTNVAQTDTTLLNKLYDRYRNLLAYTERFRDILEPVKAEIAQNLSQIIFQRIHHLQNPTDCKATKFAVCDIGKGCGFGCQIHHVAYCLIVSYATQRTLHLNGKPWSYAINGFSSIFQPLGDTDKCAAEINQNPPIEWNGADDQRDIQVLKIPIVDSIHKKPDFMPMTIPEDLAKQLKAFHTQPFVWWVGHFLRYVLRPLPSTCKSLWSEIETRFNVQMSNFSDVSPLVGIQVRRTDKLLSEAQFHGVGEYMKWVAEYYDQLEYKLGHPVVRSVYIATDEPSVFDDAKKEFPSYKFYCDPNIAKSAALNSRYSDNSLNGILIDLFWLARSDYVVCTFSSQVCRLAFALMQTLHGDAGDRFRSLDDIYYYGGQRDHLFEAILPHKAADKDEIDLDIGDRIHIAGNHWNGYSKGTNKRTSKHGLFPSYKVRDVVFVAPMPTYSEIKYQQGFKLPDDSCLVV